MTVTFFVGSTNVAMILMKNGAQINARNNLEESPLLKALEHCNLNRMIRIIFSSIF